MNLKCSPDRAEAMHLTDPEILSDFYLDKRSWIACLLGGGLPDELLRQLAGESYRPADSKLPQYVRWELAGTNDT